MADAAERRAPAPAPTTAVRCSLSADAVILRATFAPAALLDPCAVARAMAVVRERLAATGPTLLVLDLCGATCVSPALLAELAVMRRDLDRDGRLGAIAGADRRLRGLLRVLGIDRMYPIARDRPW